MAAPPPEQELRLAVVMTGGVSLAIWMGGVAAEIDQLVRARRTENKSPEQEAYAELLELSNYVPRVDVVSGTSAGGVNGALLAGAVARGKTLNGLRDIWLEVASFSDLLRSPYAKDQPSLLKGDEYFTPKLQAGITELLGDEDVAGDDIVTLLITTTLITGEDHGLMDDFGTAVPDVKHDGLFRFDGDELRKGVQLAERLALAARSSASFPVAFEPSWVPRETGDDAHPPMAGFADFRSDRYVIDGGVLVNRPIEPALRAIFAMPADVEDVSRVLLYVVPDPGESGTATPDLLTRPPMLADVALRSLVTLPRTQSIAGDLERLKEHNARVRAQRGARDLLLARLFPPDIDRDLLAGYCSRRAAREVEWLLGELNRRWPTSLTGNKIKPLDRAALARELEALRRRSLPTKMPPSGDPQPAAIAPWGLDSVERAATVTLDLAQRGYACAEEGTDVRETLAGARSAMHATLAELRRLRRARRGKLRDRGDGEPVADWAKAMLALMRTDDDAVSERARDVARTLRTAATAARGLGDDRLTLHCDRLAPSGDEGECLSRLFALEVLQDAIGIGSPVVEQTANLLQVSANTRNALTAAETARMKLTGMHLAHFAAFYKPSWRANDWMWGRLDAAGWLAQLVLDPSRLELAVEGERDRREAALERIRKIALGADGDTQTWLAARFRDDERAICDELEWLAPESKATRPTALPHCSLTVARRIQLSIAATELPGVATAVRQDQVSNALSKSGENFLAKWNDGKDRSPQHLRDTLAACDFAEPGFEAEQDSGLLATSTSGTAATLASALTGNRSGLPKLITKPKLVTWVRGLALAVDGLVTSAISRSRVAFAAIIVAMAAGGALLGAAIVADGTQSGFTSLGFTIVLAGLIVALWRAKPRWLFVLYAIVVVAICAAIARIPWAVAKLFDPGDVKDFVIGLEPAFIVLAFVVGATVFGWRAVEPRK